MAVITKQSDNSLIPGQPEYGKSWKAEFNHGCCTECGKQKTPVCTTKIQGFTRSDQSDSLITTIVDSYCRCQNQAPISGCDSCNESPKTIN